MTIHTLLSPQKASRCGVFSCVMSIWMMSVLYPQQAEAYSLSYGYLLGSSLQSEKKSGDFIFKDKHSKDFKTASRFAPSQHQLVLTDGYCMFIHQGPFNRICFEGGPGLRFAPFAFDLHFQTTLHSIWLRPAIFGFFLNAGLFSTLYPMFQGGLRFSVGFHFYFVAPAIEMQVSVDERGLGDAKIFLQIAIHIPTGSINFGMGNFGL